MLSSAISCSFFLLVRILFQLLPCRSLIQILGIGLLVAAHWICFFHAIKASTVSVTLVCLSSQTLFTSLLEPLFNRKRFSGLDVLTGLMIIVGIFLIFHFEAGYTEGIISALLAALLACLFTIFNSWQVKRHDPVLLSFYEMTGGWLGISIFLAAGGVLAIPGNLTPEIKDLFYLFLLSTVCTAFAYVWGLAVMRELSAYTVILITNMEPVYGILLAALFFGESEKMSGGFYAGSLIIIAAIFLHPAIKKYRLAIPVKRQ